MVDLFEEQLPVHLAMPGGDKEDGGDDDDKGGGGIDSTNP